MKVLGASFIALLALGAMSASGASAELPLILKQHGRVVSNGTRIEGAAFLTVQASRCWEWAMLHGTLTVNSQPKDKATFSSDEVELPCEDPTEDRSNPFGKAVEAIVTNPSGGFIKRIELTSMGHLTVRASPKLTIKLSGCLYEASKLEGNFPIPGMAHAAIRGLAKLNTRRSHRTCAKRLRVEGYAELANPETKTEAKEVFETER
jgi:hypothetical protein